MKPERKDDMSDEFFEAYKAGFKSAIEHRAPSQETRERLDKIQKTQELMPAWFRSHIEDDNRRFNGIDDSLVDIKDLLTPIAETYKTVAALGKWSKIGLATILLILSIALALKNLWPMR